MNEWINEWINDKAFYRTAPATPGLLMMWNKTLTDIRLLWRDITLSKRGFKQRLNNEFSEIDIFGALKMPILIIKMSI